MKDDKLLSMLFELYYSKQLIEDKYKNLPKEYYQEITAVPRENENVILSPLRRKCPQWMCCLLCCLNRTPSMLSYKQCMPYNACLLQENGQELMIDAESLAKGDVILLRPGNIVPADVVLLMVTDNYATSCFDLKGARMKDFEVCKPDEPLSARNMSFTGCQVFSGQAKGVVVTIGNDTLMSQLMDKYHWPVTREQAGKMSMI